MENQRMKQLVFMFSSITGKSAEESEMIIAQTETGKLVLDNNKAVLYEQQTENMYGIVEELKEIVSYKELAERITCGHIVEAMQKLLSVQNGVDYEKKLKYPKESSNVSDEIRKNMKDKYKKVLKRKDQNQRNIRRIEDADNLKRRESKIAGKRYAGY